MIEQRHEHRLTLVRLCDEKRAGSLLRVSASSVCWTCLDLDDLTAWRFARCVDFLIWCFDFRRLCFFASPSQELLSGF